MSNQKLSLAAPLILGLFFAGATTALRPHQLQQDDYPIPLAQEPEPTPMMMGLGRFEVPELPENPTQVELGENLYFYHCMPCHGDYGQGLTDEFREAWVEDHQNCWARGCHTGRPEDEGFPIPKYVPPVIASQLLIRFPTAQVLYDFLSSEHPPQNPGVLKKDEYWAVTAFLWFENDQLPSGVKLGPAESDPTNPESTPLSDRETEPVEASQTEPASDSLPRLNPGTIGIVLIGLSLFVLLVVLIRKKIIVSKFL